MSPHSGITKLIVNPAQTVSQASPQTVVATPVNGHHMTFHELLSELNPLQYLPIVGTIYRAVTGDTIPETARSIGSIVMSGLIGGPIGIATNVAIQAIEKLTGVDPEAIGQTMLASIGVGHHSAGGASAVPPDAAATGAPPAEVAAAAPAPLAWLPSQLMAYGVSTDVHGLLRHGDVKGADVLNNLELVRLRSPGAAAAIA
jgi:hypothetical protein